MNLFDALPPTAAAHPPTLTAGGSPHERMWEMITAHRISQIVRTVAQFGLPEHLAAGRSTAEAIAAAEALDPDATFRLLRAAASLGLVTSADGRTFEATELLGTLAAGALGSLRGPALALNEPGLWLPWGRLHEAIRTGTEQTTAALGCCLWDYYRATPEESSHFSEATSGINAAVGEAAARLIDTTPFVVAADIGGAGGSLIHDLLAADPDLHGIVFDLPHIVPQADAEARDRGLAERVTTVGGDFFEEVPEADAYLLRDILRYWDDEACVTILRNCRRAMPHPARVFVLEMVIGEIGEPSPAPLQDIQMLVSRTGGRERTLAEFECLLHDAGLHLQQVTPTDTPVTILEAGVSDDENRAAR